MSGPETKSCNEYFEGSLSQFGGKAVENFHHMPGNKERGQTGGPVGDFSALERLEYDRGEEEVCQGEVEAG